MWWSLLHSWIIAALMISTSQVIPIVSTNVLSIHNCLPRNSSCVTATLMVTIVTTSSVRYISSECSSWHAYIAVSSGTTWQLLSSSGRSMVPSTQIMRQYSSCRAVLVVRDAVRHYVFVMGWVATMGTGLAVSWVRLAALPRRLTLRALVIFTDGSHVQSVLHL